MMAIVCNKDSVGGAQCALDTFEMPQKPPIFFTRQCHKLEESFNALLETGLLSFGWRGQGLCIDPRKVFRQAGLLGIFVGPVLPGLKIVSSHSYRVSELVAMSAYIAHKYLVRPSR